ncbi:phosphoribosylglycinamide formyltransferase [soil metagenome]
MNICIFASGQGSNFKVIYSKTLNGYLRSSIKLLVSNNPTSGAVQFAKISGIDHLIYKSSENEINISTSDLLDALDKNKIDFIVLAGYMKHIDPVIINKFKYRIINIHPALLPEFGGKGMYGANVHNAVLKSKANVSGITIHFVDEIYDNGPVILQKEIEISPDENTESLQRKISELEHLYYPEVLKLIEEGKIEVTNNKVFIKE